MVKILISISFVLISFSTYSQHKIVHFEIGGTPYSLDNKNDLDNIFLDVFKELKRNGEASQDDWLDWVNTYNKFIDNGIKGTYIIDSIGDQLVDFRYTGDWTAFKHPEDLGLDPKGKKKHEKHTFSAHVSKPYERMARLNQELCTRILIKFNSENRK